VINAHTSLLEPACNLSEREAFLLFQHPDRLPVIFQAATAGFLFGLGPQLPGVSTELFLFHILIPERTI
jgi:hypothetical protein